MDSAQTARASGPDLGALVFTREHAAVGHTIGAACVFGLPTVILSSIVLFTKQNPGVTPMTLSEKLAMIGFIVALAGGAGLFLFIRGRRGRKTVEVYERGIRLRRPSGDEVVFKYADVRELRRRTIRGGLAGVEFNLNDGASYEIGVHAKADVQMLNYILAQYGPIKWQPDNRFRLM